MRQLMREHIHPKHIIHLMHDENMKISCERSKENYTTGITSILDGRIACNVGGAQHRGPHMETQRGPSTDGACAGTISFNDSYGLGRHGAVHLLLFSVLLHYTSNVYIYIYMSCGYACLT